MNLRHSILMVAAGLLLSCCSSEGPDGAGAEVICFTGSAEPLTTRGEPLGADYSLWVQALHHVDADNSYLFFGSATEFGLSDGLWKGVATDYYYPISGSMEFLAFAVHNKALQMPSVSFAPKADGSAFESMTLDFGSKLTGFDDAVLFSDTKLVERSAMGGIPALRLTHGLSQVTVTARSLTSLAASQIIINQVTLKQLHPSGTLSIAAAPTTQIISGSEVSETGSEAEWSSLSGSPQDFTLFASTDALHPLWVASNADPGTQVGRTLYMPTQSAAPSPLTIVIDYTIINAGKLCGTYRKTVTLGDVQWLPGSKYTYILDCNITEITVTAPAGNAVVDILHEETIVSDEEYLTTP